MYLFFEVKVLKKIYFISSIVRNDYVDNSLKSVFITLVRYTRISFSVV